MSTRPTSSRTVYSVVLAAIVLILVLAYLFRPPPVKRTHGATPPADAPP